MKKEKNVKQGSILKQQLTILQFVESSPSVLWAVTPKYYWGF